MSKWFEGSNVKWFRRQAEDQLVEAKKLTPSQNKEETAVEFWARLERAGLLEEALKLYDEIAESYAEWVHTPRETKKMFAERIEREGRQAEIEEQRQFYSELGYSLREIHEMLVDDFQPLDGSQTRPWTTPNPWENGRLFRKKEDQKRFAAEIEAYDKNDYCPKNRWRYEWNQMHQEKRRVSTKAEWRVDCAKWRRDERIALANAHKRVRELRASVEFQRALEVVHAFEEAKKSSKTNESSSAESASTNGATAAKS
jgi:hypothetical protein